MAKISWTLDWSCEIYLSCTTLLHMAFDFGLELLRRTMTGQGALPMVVVEL
jgi:hypothetical protein